MSLNNKLGLAKRQLLLLRRIFVGLAVAGVLERISKPLPLCLGLLPSLVVPVQGLALLL